MGESALAGLIAGSYRGSYHQGGETFRQIRQAEASCLVQ